MDITAGNISGRTVAVNRDGTTAVRLVQVVVTDLRDVQTAYLMGSTGDESNPPNGAAVALLSTGEGCKLAVATDDQVTPVMDVGGKRIYSTDGAGAEVMAEVRLDPDGKITVANGAASVILHPDGALEFRGTSSTFDHPITAPEVIFNDIPATTHRHLVPGTDPSHTAGPTT